MRDREENEGSRAKGKQRGPDAAGGTKKGENAACRDKTPRNQRLQKGGHAVKRREDPWVAAKDKRN